MATLARPPEPEAPCVPARTVRRFTALKLLILLLIAAALVATPFLATAAPTLTPPPPEVLAGELAIHGAGAPNSTVELQGNDAPLGTTRVDDDGAWRLGVPFAAGRYQLAAVGVGRAGRRVTDEAGRATVTVYDRPTLAVAAAPATAAGAAVTLSGTGSPGSRLRLLHNEQPLAELTVADDGAWTHALVAPAPSENEFVAQVLDGNGAALGASAPGRLSVAPLPARAVAPLQVEHAAFAELARGEVTGTVGGALGVRGTGEPGAWLALWREGGRVTLLIRIAPDGTWRLNTRQFLPPGEQQLMARMESVGGEVLAEGPITLLVPAPPTLAHEGGATDVDDVALRGTSVPGDSLTLIVNGDVLATVAAGADGAWQHTTRLPAGDHRAVVRSANGLPSEEATLTVALARPEILGQQRDAGGQPLPGFYGRGRPQTQLQVLVGETAVGEALVDANGQWRCACTLGPGEHTVRVRETAEPARESAPLTITVANALAPFAPGTGDPDAPPFRCPDDSPLGVIDGTFYVIGCGESLSVIAVRLGVSVEQLLAHNPQLAAPPRIYFGQRLNIPAGAACFDDTAAG